MVTEKLDQPESGIGLGLVKGLAVTLKAMLRPAMTQAYTLIKGYMKEECWGWKGDTF